MTDLLLVNQFIVTMTTYLITLTVHVQYISMLAVMIKIESMFGSVIEFTT